MIFGEVKVKLKVKRIKDKRMSENEQKCSGGGGFMQYCAGTVINVNCCAFLLLQFYHIFSLLFPFCSV